MGWVSDDVLLELVKLSREVLTGHNSQVDELARLTGRIDILNAKVGDVLYENAEIRGDIGEANNRLEIIMAQATDLKAAVADLKRENAELKDFIAHYKEAELAEKTERIVALLAQIAVLDANQITPQLQADIDEATADVRAVVADLDAYTPAVVAPPLPGPPVEPEPEPTPIEEQP